MSDFNATYDAWYPKLRRASYDVRNQWAGYSDPDEVFSEMLYVLFVVWQREPEADDFAAYYWRSWNNHVARLALERRRRYRTEELVLGIEDIVTGRAVEDEPMFAAAEILASLDPVASAVALMRVGGWRAREVREHLGLTVRQYRSATKTIAAVILEEGP